MQEPTSPRLPAKRKLLFQNEMLMDFPDPSSLPTIKSIEDKGVEWLKHLDAKHRIQRSRLRAKHISEYQSWQTDTRNSIDPDMYRNHISPFQPRDKEHFFQPSLPLLEKGKTAIELQGARWRSILVSIAQMENMLTLADGREMDKDKDAGEVGVGKGMVFEKDRYALRGMSSVEFAAELGKVGVGLRREMVKEMLEMRWFQAKEKELVWQFLLKLDGEKYGARPGGLLLTDSSGQSGQPVRTAMKSGIGRTQIDMARQQQNQGLNITIPPQGSRSIPPPTTPGTAGDGYFQLSRDPRLPPSSATTPTSSTPFRLFDSSKDPRLAMNPQNSSKPSLTTSSIEPQPVKATSALSAPVTPLSPKPPPALQPILPAPQQQNPRKRQIGDRSPTQSTTSSASKRLSLGGTNPDPRGGELMMGPVSSSVISSKTGESPSISHSELPSPSFISSTLPSGTVAAADSSAGGVGSMAPPPRPQTPTQQQPSALQPPTAGQTIGGTSPSRQMVIASEPPRSKG